MQNKASDEAIIYARNIAKMFGGKALKGSAKQKAWAEKLRENILNKITEVQAEIICTCALFSHAKFWIETRDQNRPAAEFAERAEKCFVLLKEANKLIRHANATIKTEILTI